jgi:hypothetical protein
MHGRALVTVWLRIFRLLLKALEEGEPQEPWAEPDHLISISRFASIGAVLLSPKVSKGIRDGSGYW